MDEDREPDRSAVLRANGIAGVVSERPLSAVYMPRYIVGTVVCAVLAAVVVAFAVRMMGGGAVAIAMCSGFASTVLGLIGGNEHANGALRARARRGRCVVCGYDLTGFEPAGRVTCPECGSVIVMEEGEVFPVASE